MDATRADVEFTAEVCAIAVAEGANVINIPDTVGYTTPEEYTRLPAPALRAGAGARRRRALGPLPRRPRAGRRELLRRPARRRAPGRVRDQRARRARRQLLARGDRDAAAHAPRQHGLDTGLDTREIARTSRMVSPLHRLRGAAEQGDRRPQRVRARVRHPPGRRPQGADHLRDHGPDRTSASSRTRSSSASTPAATRSATRSSSSASRSRATPSTRRSRGSRRSPTRRSR